MFLKMEKKKIILRGVELTEVFRRGREIYFTATRLSNRTRYYYKGFLCGNRVDKVKLISHTKFLEDIINYIDELKLRSEK